MFTQDTLATKSGPELVAIFNGLDGVSPVKRFRNRETGVKRILVQAGVMELFGVVPEVAANDDEEVAAVEEVTTRPSKVRGIYNEAKKDVIRSFRPNSRRGRLITLLRDGGGATFDQLLANSEVGFNTEDVLHKTIRILNWWTGYGINTDAAGIITLTF